MAEAEVPQDLAELYAAVEVTYCEDRWSDVLRQGKALLEEIGDRQDPTATAVRQRLQLLMAHTHLHGFGDRHLAEDLYRAILVSKSEPALRQAAEHGLQLCNRPLSQPEAAEGAETAPAPKEAQQEALPPVATAGDLPQPVAAAELPDMAELAAASPAMPWIEAEPSRPESTRSSPKITTAATPWAAIEPATPESPGEATQERSAPELEPEPPLTQEATIPPAPAIPADVVEDPGLLEVYQADARLREELELRPVEAHSVEAPPHVSTSTPDGQSAWEVEPGAMAIPALEEHPGRLLEASGSDSPGWSQQQNSPEEMAEPLPGSEPVAEDPELLRSLLTVVVG
ncbi:MAG: hypothetical protein ACK5FE_02305 [Cyanobacteriota bacterium]|jgi:hypothetical protein